MSAQQQPPSQQQGKGGRPGAMTMAMQAVQAEKPAGPKVLRIGLIQGGKILEERIIRKRETVSVGTSEKNHFVLGAEDLPARFDLFQIVGSDYILNFTDKMKGRVGLPGGVQDLQQMRQSGQARQSGDHYQVKLTDNSRGKVTIGDVTLLFQFVQPPPVQPRPQLPAAARSGFVRGVDWVFTAHITFAFMAMFSLIVYMENADWPIDQGMQKVPDRVAKMIFEEPPPPEPETVEEEAPDEGEEAEAEEKVAEKKPQPEKKPTPSPGPDDAAKEKAMAEKGARIAEEAAQAAESLIVGALSNEAGGALQDVLAGGAVTGNAEEILSQAAGVGVAEGKGGGTLRTRSGGGDGSGAGGDLGSLAKAKGGTKKRSEGKKVQERRIRGSADVGSGGDIGGAGMFDPSLVVRQIKRRLGAIKACYERELRKNPTLSGKVVVNFTIQERGNVTGAKASTNTTGDPNVARCVTNAVRRFRFNPGPDGGSVTFSYPFVFSPQG